MSFTSQKKKVSIVLPSLISSKKENTRFDLFGGLIKVKINGIVLDAKLLLINMNHVIFFFKFYRQKF